MRIRQAHALSLSKGANAWQSHLLTSQVNMLREIAAHSLAMTDKKHMDALLNGNPPSLEASAGICASTTKCGANKKTPSR